LFEELGSSRSSDLNSHVKDFQDNFLNKKRSVKIIFGGEEVGILGEIGKNTADNYKIKNRLAVCILDLEKIFSTSGETRTYQAINRFPIVERDISFFIDKKVAYKEVVESIEKTGSELFQRVELPFEPFEKDGKKSLTCRIFLGSDQRTLESHEIESELGRVISKLESDYQIEVRK
jgi:phenylalanyl-tRNA synthetase beta chain